VLDKNDQQKYSVAEGDTEGFVNMPLSIARVRMSILAKEDNEKIRISIRSKKGTSANGCARAYFNGGGHENAAGGRLNMPDDISGVEAVAEYIERQTHIYLNQENENN
jgi:phosphoesterase RecJ-like protein